MHSVESIAAEIVRREGGYVNDPDDPGGATNHGVTIHTMKGLGLDLTGDGKVDTADVKALAPQQAAEIYVRHYFHGPKLNLLPAPLQPSVFDMQVNAGSNAVRILQRLMAAFGLPLKDDGVIGPITARTVARAMEMAPDHLVDAYGIARRNYYYRLADGRPASRKYARAPGRRQGRLDRPRRGVHLRALPADPRRASRRGPRHGRDRQDPRRRRRGARGRRGRRRRRRGLRRQPRRPRGDGRDAGDRGGRAVRRRVRPRRRQPLRRLRQRAEPAAAAAARALDARALRLRDGRARRLSAPGCRASRWCPSRSGGCSARSSPSTSARASCTTSARGRRCCRRPLVQSVAAPEPVALAAPPVPAAIDPDHNAAVEEWRRRAADPSGRGGSRPAARRRPPLAFLPRVGPGSRPAKPRPKAVQP